MLTLKNEFVATPNSEHIYKMIEREEKDGVRDEKKKAFSVFIFYAKKIV